MPKLAMMINRVLKRVPLDFDWPLNNIWPGYMFSLCGKMEDYFPKIEHDERCNLCRKFANIMKWEIQSHGCPGIEALEPPKGEGYQCWETTSEGSPISPVFKTLDTLCLWLANNSGDQVTRELTKDEWFDVLKEKSITMDMATNHLLKKEEKHEA